jgi:hypothetical protein
MEFLEMLKRYNKWLFLMGVCHWQIVAGTPQISDFSAATLPLS